MITLRKTLFLFFTLFVAGSSFAQKSSNKLWSVRMAESEMSRYPQSWQLDFQTRLKWDYCHGLELQAFLDLYDAYNDKKYFDYAVSYADTMVCEDGSIKTYTLNEYNIDRLNSGKILFRIYEQTNEWMQDSPLLRRCNVAYFSERFAESNPYRLSRELLQLRNQLAQIGRPR